MKIPAFLRLNFKRWNRLNGAAILGTWILTCFLYPFLHQDYGESIAVIFRIPIILTAWTLGGFAGMFGGLVVLALMFFYIPADSSFWTVTLSQLPQVTIAVLAGAVVGWVSNLFHESQEQSAELALEKKALIEQISLRQQAEQVLHTLNVELEERVLQRTEALMTANQELTRASEERKVTEAKLSTSEERLRQMAETIEDMTWLIDLPNNLTLYVSPACELIYGIPQEQLQQNPWLWLERVYLEDRERINTALQKHIDNHHSFDEEYRIVCEDGSIKWVWTRAFLLTDGQGNITRIAGNTKDITARKQAEVLIQGSLREKEVLLKEIHHRVKNNLQVISSLLNLAAARITDPASQQAFIESQNRIHSMALIHEKLYQAKDLAQIDFKDYIRNFTSFLFHSYQNGKNCATLHLEVQDISLNIDTAIPCGLILNELVSNALKYAFPTGQAGEIRVRFYQENAQEYCLEVADTGAGLPAGFDERPASTLGLVLVKTLADQLGGSLQIDSRHGARFSICFPVPENHA